MRLNNKTWLISKIGVYLVALALLGAAFAQTGTGTEVAEPPKIYSPYVARTVADSNFAEGVYWGDTHLHTSYSTDAGMLGNTLGPEEAYNYAVPTLKPEPSAF